jgi:hypothetical protein
MNHDTISQNQKPAHAAPWATTEELNQTPTDFSPAPDEVARRAYFSYVNQGSRQGDEVQHWLTAEAELIAESNRTREHGSHAGVQPTYSPAQESLHP